MTNWPVATLLPTERMLLEPLTPAHATEMVEVLAAPALYTYVGGEAPSVLELRERYRRQSVGHSPDGAQGWLNWIIRERSSGKAIGFTQATLMRADAGLLADIAWVINPRSQGNGFASEAAQAMSEWLQENGVVRLVAFINPENGPSIGVARHLGMRTTDISVDGEDRWEL